MHTQKKVKKNTKKTQNKNLLYVSDVLNPRQKHCAWVFLSASCCSNILYCYFWITRWHRPMCPAHSTLSMHLTHLLRRCVLLCTSDNTVIIVNQNQFSFLVSFFRRSSADFRPIIMKPYQSLYWVFLSASYSGSPRVGSGLLELTRSVSWPDVVQGD